MNLENFLNDLKTYMYTKYDVWNWLIFSIFLSYVNIISLIHYRLTSKIQMSLMPTHLGGEHLQMRCALRLIKDHPRLKNHLLYIESNMKILLRIFPVSFPKGFCNHYSIITFYVEKDNDFQKAFKVKIVAQLKFFSEKATYFQWLFPPCTKVF